MAYTGIFCTEAEITFKAGENIDATGNTEANRNSVMKQIESYINVATGMNWSDVYSSLNADLKGILSECASDLAAIYFITYNMSGYTSRIEAESMINVLYRRAQDCLKVLREEGSIKFITEV